MWHASKWERKTMICQENRQGNCRYLCLTAQRHGAYRDIFKKFKGSFEKIFITGVSPVTLDDVNTNDQGLQATCKHVCKQTIRHSFNCHLRFRLPKTIDTETLLLKVESHEHRIGIMENLLRDAKQVLTLEEASLFMGISKSSLYKMTHKHELLILEESSLFLSRFLG